MTDATSCKIWASETLRTSLTYKRLNSRKVLLMSRELAPSQRDRHRSQCRSLSKQWNRGRWSLESFSKTLLSITLTKRRKLEQPSVKFDQELLTALNLGAVCRSQSSVRKVWPPSKASIA